MSELALDRGDVVFFWLMVILLDSFKYTLLPHEDNMISIMNTTAKSFFIIIKVKIGLILIVIIENLCKNSLPKVKFRLENYMLL